MAAITKVERERRGKLLEQSLKFCPRCEQTLSLTAFAKNKQNIDGLQSYCRKCCAVYYYADRECRLQWQKDYAKKHLDEIQKRNRQYYCDHRDDLLEQERERYYKNKEARSEYYYKYARTQQGREARKTSSHRRKAREAMTTSDLTVHQWRSAIEYFGGRCAYCGAESDVLHQDHFIPVKLGGGLTVGNIIPSCPRCNLSKGQAVPDEWASKYGIEYMRPGAIEKIEDYLREVV